jgi:3-isopropylmalate/(R)-2-methylmalate dehydratase small subunit
VFEVNGVHTIIAQSYARIFRQNMFNGGMLAIELPKQDIDALFELQKQGSVTLNVDVDAQIIQVNVAGQTHEFPFEISEFDKALVKAGGWVEFADARY